MSKADDWIEIFQLKSRYSWYFDTPDLEGLIDLFTDDAVCDFGPYGTWEGKDAIRAGFEREAPAPDNHFPTVHATASPIIEIDGDEATGRYFLLDNVLTGAPGEPTTRLVAAYHERYRREGGRWRIAHSRIDFFWSAETGRITQQAAAERLSFHPQDNPN